MLLSVRNLEVAHGQIAALQDVSLDVHEGEVVALIGANGAGKTTLLRAISGLLRPRRGSIEYHAGGDGPLFTHTMPPHRIVRLGISHVPEGRQIFANLTVRENLVLGAYQESSAAEVRRLIGEVCNLFPVLGERSAQRAGTLSGGEQQMLAIGRALMARPRLLLLDEPSLGLAPLFVRQIFRIIQKLNAAGTTILLVEQNAHMALNIAQRGYVLQTGRVTLSDRAAALLQHPEVKRAYLGG